MTIMEWKFFVPTGPGTQRTGLKINSNNTFKITKIFLGSESALVDFNPKGEISNSIFVTFPLNPIPNPSNVGIIIEDQNSNIHTQITDIVWIDNSNIKHHWDSNSKEIRQINTNYFPPYPKK